MQDHLGDLRFKQRRFADAAAAWERALSGGRSINRSRKNRGQDSRGSRPEVNRGIRPAPAVLSLVIASCAPRIVALPSGDGTDFPDYAPAYERATASCSSVRSLVAILSISGNAFRQRLRAKLDAGFEAPRAFVSSFRRRVNRSSRSWLRHGSHAPSAARRASPEGCAAGRDSRSARRRVRQSR